MPSSSSQSASRGATPTVRLSFGYDESERITAALNWAVDQGAGNDPDEARSAEMVGRLNRLLDRIAAEEIMAMSRLAGRLK